MKSFGGFFAGLILFANICSSQIMVASLRDGVLPPGLEIIGPGASSVAFTSSGASFNGLGMIGNAEGRAYIRTIYSNMLSSGFVAEITMSFAANQPSIAWYGIGADSVNSSFYNEPTGASMMIVPHTNTGGELDGRIQYGDRSNSINQDGGIFHNASSLAYKMRLTWDIDTSFALFEVDTNYTGGEFIADTSKTIFGGDNGFNSTNSRLFFGGSDGVTFKDLSIVPEPSALSLLAVGLGVVLRRRRRTV
jgi:hypothetical protein